MGIFGSFFMEHGPDITGFWSNALLSGDAAGLTWDLVFSALIVTLLAFRDRESLGTRGVVGITLVTAILGVCGGLGLYVLLSGPRD